METRPYFLLGDLLSNAAVGALAGGVLALLFSPAWNMLLAMLAGMALGMIIALLPALLLSTLFGAMEVIVPVMTTGMVAGMAVSMAAAMHPMNLLDGVRAGAMVGIAVLFATYVANAVIKGKAAEWTS